MPDNWHPKRAAPPQSIAEKRAENNPGEEPEKLHVHCAEYHGGNPNSGMDAHRARFKYAQQCSAEEHLFGKTGEHAHSEDNQNQRERSVVLDERIGNRLGSVLGSAEILLYCRQRFGKCDALVPTVMAAGRINAITFCNTVDMMMPFCGASDVELMIRTNRVVIINPRMKQLKRSVRRCPNVSLLFMSLLSITKILITDSTTRNR